jgi:hypothetical protein
MFRLSLAVGLVFACLIALLYSPFHPTARPGDYWFALPVWGIASSLVYIALCWPKVWHVLQSELTEVHRLKTEAWKYQQEREARPAVSAYLTPQITVLSDHDRAWRHWLIRCAIESERVGGVSYQKMKSFFGGDQVKWRAYVDTLSGWGKCWPVQPRVETFLRPGITPALLYDLLVGGEIPPLLPDGPPPVLQQRQQANESTAQYSGETDADSLNTASTAYSAEH